MDLLERTLQWLEGCRLAYLQDMPGARDQRVTVEATICWILVDYNG